MGQRNQFKSDYDWIILVTQTAFDLMADAYKLD